MVAILNMIRKKGDSRDPGNFCKMDKRTFRVLVDKVMVDTDYRYRRRRIERDLARRPVKRKVKIKCPRVIVVEGYSPRRKGVQPNKRSVTAEEKPRKPPMGLFNGILNLLNRRARRTQ